MYDWAFDQQLGYLPNTSIFLDHQDLQELDLIIQSSKYILWRIHYNACFFVCTNWPFVVFLEMASWSSLTFLSLKTLRSLMRPPLSRCRGIWLDSKSRIHKKSCSHKFPNYIVKWERKSDLADHSYWRVVCVGRNRMVWIDIFTHNWCAIKLSRRIYTLNMIHTSITLLHTTKIRWQNDIDENGLNKDFYRYVLHIFVYTTFKTRKRPG